MTFNNSVLLIIKQNTGLDYNDLFARIVSRYKNPSSANSALSRALKNLVSFGLIKKEGNNLFITDKGSASISIEMKEKLVLKLNESMKKPLPNIEEIIKLLIVLSQRAAQSPELLSNAKENASFTIKDVEDVRAKIKERRIYLKKMSLLLKVQEEKLRELDFNDSIQVTFDEMLVEKIVSFSVNDKLVLETRDSELERLIPQIWRKQSEYVVEKENIGQLCKILLEKQLFKANIYFSGIKINVNNTKANCFASYKTLKKFFGEKK